MVTNLLMDLASMTIEDIMPFIWLFVFILSVIVEFATAELVSIWFIFASIISVILSFIPGIPFYVEIIVFVVLSAIQIAFLRKFFKKLFKTKEFKSNSDSMIGQKVLVIKDIPIDQMGEIKYKGIVWSAYSNEEIIHEGEYVYIESIEGNRLFVRKETK